MREGLFSLGAGSGAPWEWTMSTLQLTPSTHLDTHIEKKHVEICYFLKIGWVEKRVIILQTKLVRGQFLCIDIIFSLN